jgi:serine/threonine-protein kinase
MIFRCLARDPELRPQSVREVYDSLPGGDALAAALAAGETPSPRAIAAAGNEGTLSPAKAWMILGGAIILAAIVVTCETQRELPMKVPFDKPPVVLEQRAVEIAEKLGYAPERYRVTGFQSQPNYLAWISEHDKSPDRWQRLRKGPASLTFWMREWNRPLTPEGFAPRAQRDDPPDIAPGMTTVVIDTTGRLVALRAMVDATRPAKTLDWTRMASLAGLDLATFAAAAPRDAPPLFADARAAWNGKHPDDGTPIHVEAASARGAPVYFRVTGKWDEDVEAANRLIFQGHALALFEIVFTAFVILFSVVLVMRNLRLRRGDRKGALRIAAALAAVEWLAFMLSADHRVNARHEASRVFAGTAAALYWGAAFLLVYIALEPFVRRRWPDRLISWSRLIAGNWNDPMVGRDILIGITAGLGHAALATVTNWLPGVLGIEPPLPPHLSDLDPLLAMRFAAAHVLESLSNGVINGFVLIIALVALTIVLRRRSLAVVALALVIITGFTAAFHGNPHLVPFGVCIAVLLTFVMVRFGLLAFAALQATFSMTFAYPIGLDFSSWTVATALVPLVVTTAAAAWAFKTALGGQPVFSGALFAED